MSVGLCATYLYYLLGAAFLYVPATAAAAAAAVSHLPRCGGKQAGPSPGRLEARPSLGHRPVDLLERVGQEARGHGVRDRRSPIGQSWGFRDASLSSVGYSYIAEGHSVGSP